MFVVNLSAATPARHAVAAIGGTAKNGVRDAVGGARLSVATIRLETDNPDSVLTLRWDGLDPASLGITPRLRLGLVSNLRAFQHLEVTLPDQTPLGTIDLSLASSFELLELVLPGDQLAKVLSAGIEIRARGTGDPVELFGPGGESAPELWPHLLQPGTRSPREEFLQRMASPASLTSYGWMAGSVFDGLSALATLEPKDNRFGNTLRDQLERFFPEDRPLRTGFSVEFTLGYAQLARSRPKHPELSSVVAYWAAKLKSSPTGAITENITTTAEGNYTVAWPLAVIAREWNRPDLAQMAVHELRHRRDRLVSTDGAIWLRHRQGSEAPHSFRLWGRGVAWYFLGLARTLDVLPVAPPDLVTEIQRTANYLLSLQRNDGMWGMFADDPQTASESSGTAGIATALAIGVRRGWLREREALGARRALAGLESRLTPDGFLPGTAPENKREGGEAFQRKSKGYIMQIGMGLMAQLMAELEMANFPKQLR